MKLPHAHLALVEQDKIVGYLLNADHRYGASKARYLTGLGFRQDAWKVLAAALREHAERNEVVRVKHTGYGPRYEVDGILRGPENRRAHVRTIWQIDEGHVVPRLITAHPQEADE